MIVFFVVFNEIVWDLDYEKWVVFLEEEVNVFWIVLNEVVFNEFGDFVWEMNFEEGVVLYILFGLGKYELVSRNLYMLNIGVGYFFNFFKNLKWIYFQLEKLEKLLIQIEVFVVLVGFDDY